jgi:hypothetical protein
LLSFFILPSFFGSSWIKLWLLADCSTFGGILKPLIWLFSVKSSTISSSSGRIWSGF